MCAPTNHDGPHAEWIRRLFRSRPLLSLPVPFKKSLYTIRLVFFDINAALQFDLELPQVFISLDFRSRSVVAMIQTILSLFIVFVSTFLAWTKWKSKVCIPFPQHRLTLHPSRMQLMILQEPEIN